MNINELCVRLKNYSGKELRIMEICGTHTASIEKNGLKSLLSDKIRLVSGPGCPVCVTVSEYIDRLIELAANKNSAVVSFGDMLRVPGSGGSLSSAKALGADVRMVYSPFEMLALAKKEPQKTFIFAAVGFETTTPVYARLIQRAESENILNIKILSSLKTMPAAIDLICSMGKTDGFIAPGHVCTVAGAHAFDSVAEKHGVPFAVSGFMPEEILASIYALTLLQGTGKTVNLYKNAVKSAPNSKAAELVGKYFEPCAASWRGFGEIKNSGLVLKKEYSRFDAGSRQNFKDSPQNSACICKKIICGDASPRECPLFARACTPDSPCGACMVSHEGACFNSFIKE